MTGLKRKWDRIIIIWFKLLGIVWPSNESDSEREEQMT